MPENAPETFSITSIEFIFRRPWLFISSVVIIMSLVYSKVSLDPLEYESKAVLSFETAEDSSSDRFSEKKLVRIKTNLVKKALLGDSIRSIVREVWPEVGEQEYPSEYNKLLENLRSPKKGIQIVDEKKSPPNLLELSYRNEDPEVCYKALLTTIDAIKRENKRETEEKMEAKLSFLRDQLEFYREKINLMNKEISDIRDELVQRFPELTEREKDLVAEIGVKRQSGLVKQGSLETFVMYDEMLTKLNLELLEAEKNKENLEKRLKSGTYIPKVRPEKKSTQQDIFVGEYSKAIVNKELQIAELRSRGYTQNHPEVRKIQLQIDRLKTMTGERLTSLEEEDGSGLYEREVAKEKAVSEIEEINFQIESLEDKINLIEERRKISQEQLKPVEGEGKSNVYERTGRLKDLQNEYQINEGYYLDIRKQLEEAELKARLEQEEAGFKIDVIEEPLVPLDPISYQKVKLLMLGLIISLMVGSGLAYFVDSLDNSVRSAKELRDLLSIPVFASIDRMNTAKEIMTKRVHRNTIIIILFIFVILSKILVKFFNAIS